ncbi:multidrug ABC transporter ATP-binding protein [Anaerocolumna cellulosilytica]|uniref:Multidrug ABC transporter ATP-binding protein n=1 Tax=Anaerocolumna cellulosilytica TaxID=433286 RepID=A0A6S6RAJ9_9FIRM|nr:ABC transporter ATP-binding protein [Anaerocolumna cellulosilytica]MBB5195426.1 ATP-binding cassette subfamily B protein [Anaerocolumna cellulosilytica]BCJ95958.1 multidrug ABC transporter ATP-binding protein [Anaerocolumna cellulosilytica]
MSKLLRYLKPHKKILVGAIIFLFFNNFSAMFLPTLTANLINVGVANSDIDYIYRISMLMFIVAVLGGLSSIISAILSSRVTASFSRDLREAVFIKAQQYSLNDFQTIGTASMITRCTNDITIIQRSGMMFLRVILPAPVMTVVGLTLAFKTNAKMAFFFVAVIVIFGIMAYIIGRKAVPLFRKIQMRMDRLTYVLREGITGVRVIRAFNREEFEKQRFKDSCKDYKDIAVKTNKIFAILIPFLFLILDLSVASIIWFGGIQVSNGSMEIGSIFALIEYLTIILFCSVMAVMGFMEIPRALSSASRINEILNLTPEINDQSVNITENTQKGTLEFRDVMFQYPNAEEPVLSHITFTAKPGQTTAIIGGTGSGKSTVANLIPHFFHIQKGEILLNGINIADYPQKSLRDKIGFIPQKAFLFRGTIESNIRFGKEDATMEEIQAAAKTAQAHEFILGLEDGYKSYVAQSGSNLSGGQKQRVAIARALLKKPEVYVFDDSFSALDFKTDAMLRKALRNEVKEAAVVIVAQRISTILDADQIIVLDEGKMAGMGRHEELMKTCTIYQQIAATQLSEDELSKKEDKDYEKK